VRGWHGAPGDAIERGMAPWRAMRPADLAAVVALAGAIHPHHPERPAVFAERLALAPAGCLVLATAGAVEGYAISHPWRLGGPPALDTLLGALPPAPACWHIHDIALDPRLRGQGHAAAALRLVLAGAMARGFGRASLLAIDGLAPYWERQGFVAAPAEADGALAGYGAGAVWMLRDLT